MSRLARVVVAALIGAGLGVQVFFSLLVAPAAFRLLERPLAGRLLDGLFSGYYLFGVVAMGLALLLALALALAEPRAPLRWGAAGLLLVVVAGTLYAGQVLLPQARATRLRAETAPAGDLVRLEFMRLHRRASFVNVALFGVGLATLVLHAATRPSR